MPKGPNGQKRPADAIGCAVLVGRIATGEAEEDGYVSPGRKRSGQAGAAARANSLSPEVRKAAAKLAAKARWQKEECDMTIVADPLAGLLFGQERALVNLKLLRGDDPQVTEGELRAEAHSALVQVLLGNCESFADFPEDRAAKRINVGDLTSI
jgi:hypothetical protein